MESEENVEELCKSTGSTVNPAEVHESVKVEAQENMDESSKVISAIPENLNGNQNDVEQKSQVGEITENVAVEEEVKDSFEKNREENEENTGLQVKTIDNVQSMQSTHDFNIQVIKSVKEYPCLHDRANEDFNNPGKKAEAWNDIADKLKKNVNECRERYESLFQRFAETHVMLQNPKVLEQDLPKKKFIHYEDMLFAKAAIDMEQCSKTFVESPNQEKSLGEKRLRECEEQLSFQTNFKFQKLESGQFLFDEPGSKKKGYKFTMQLIQAAKEYPSIYKNYPSYSCRAQREDWAKIARKLNKSVKKCRMAYDSLYHKFSNNYIARICPEIKPPRKSFPYYKHMRFLEPYLPIERIKQTMFKSLGLKFGYQQNYLVIPNICNTGPDLHTFQSNSEMQGGLQPEISCQNAASDALIDKSEDSQQKNEIAQIENVNTEESEVESTKLPTIRVIAAASEKSENVTVEREDFNVQLIRNVKEYPCIWDQAHPHFGNFTVQYEAWCDISKRLGSIPQECHQTFIALYAKFAQIYIKLKDSELDKTERDEFPYYEEMMFLNYQQRIQELKFNPNFNYPRPVRYPLIYSHINAQTKQPRRLMRSQRRQLQYSLDNRPNSTITQQSTVNQQIETTLQTFQLKLNDITATLDEKTKTTEVTKPTGATDAIEPSETIEASETIKTTDETTQSGAMHTQNEEQNTEQSEHQGTQENQTETGKNEAMDTTVFTENNDNSKNNTKEFEDSDADPIDIALRTEFLTDHEFNKRLIETVKEYPCIYGKGHDHFVNFPNKFHAWVKIAERLKRKRDECQKIFESLSLKFAQTHAMLQDPELVRRGFPKQPFPYYKDLMYIKDFLSMDDARKQVELMTRPPPVQHRFGQPKFNVPNQQTAFTPQQQHPNPVNPAPGPPKSQFFGPNQQNAFSQQQSYTNPINPAPGPPKPQFFGPNPANLAAWNQFLQQPPLNFQQPAAFNHSAAKDSLINIQSNLHIDFFFMCLCQQVKRTNMSDKDFVDLQIAIMNTLSSTVSKRRN